MMRFVDTKGRAFLFDLDGTLLNNEPVWEEEKQGIYQRIFGEEITGKLGVTMGINLDDIYELARANGATVSKNEVVAAFELSAVRVYSEAPITEGVNELAQGLVSLGYRLGVVSASPLPWVETAVRRLPFASDIELVLSLHGHTNLPQKPAPDGYLAAMHELGATPSSTIILEDSNTGIQAGKASSAFTIGLKQNLIAGYVQQGADVYADTMADVLTLVREREQA
jgi:beta-phosphoglucomutase-like phosphatase (HAD superfamily)